MIPINTNMAPNAKITLVKRFPAKCIPAWISKKTEIYPKKKKHISTRWHFVSTSTLRLDSNRISLPNFMTDMNL
jgi:hypothetical protein